MGGNTWHVAKAWRAVRDDLTAATAGLPHTTVGRVARAIAMELFRTPGRHDIEGDAAAWARRVDVGASIDSIGRALRLLAGRTALVERMPGRRAVYGCRIGRVVRQACAVEPADVDVAVLARAVEQRTSPRGWEAPDVALLLPAAVRARRLLGESVAPHTWTPASRAMVAHLRGRGVVAPEALGADVARLVAGILRRRPGLLQRRRRLAGIGAGEEHRLDYSSRVAACSLLESWADEDARTARRFARNGPAARRLEVFRLRASLGLDLKRRSGIRRGAPEPRPEKSIEDRASDGRFIERPVCDEFPRQDRIERRIAADRRKAA